MALENIPNGFGGAFQYYIEDFATVLAPIRKFRLQTSVSWQNITLQGRNNMIEAENGRVTFGSLVIEESMTRDAFSKSEFCAVLNATNPDADWFSAKVQPQESESGWVFAHLWFHDQMLTMVSIAISKERDESWDDWSLEKEMARKRLHDRILALDLGDKRDFAWGTVESAYVQQTGGSVIVVKYTR